MEGEEKRSSESPKGENFDVPFISLARARKRTAALVPAKLTTLASRDTSQAHLRHGSHDEGKGAQSEPFPLTSPVLLPAPPASQKPAIAAPPEVRRTSTPPGTPAAFSHIARIRATATLQREVEPKQVPETPKKLRWTVLDQPPATADPSPSHPPKLRPATSSSPSREW